MGYSAPSESVTGTPPSEHTTLENGVPIAIRLAVFNVSIAMANVMAE